MYIVVQYCTKVNTLFKIQVRSICQDSNGAIRGIRTTRLARPIKKFVMLTNQVSKSTVSAGLGPSYPYNSLSHPKAK